MYFGVGLDATNISTSNAAMYFDASNNTTFKTAGKINLGYASSTPTNKLSVYDGGTSSTRTGIGYAGLGDLDLYAAGGGSSRIFLGVGYDPSTLTTSTAAMYVSSSNQAVFPNTATSNQFKLSALNTAPASASDTGTLGEIRITSGYIYICTATNTWVRAALSTW
jgi:hypothetical protein